MPGIGYRATPDKVPHATHQQEFNRFNGLIVDVRDTHHFSSRADLQGKLLRYVALYSHQLPQSALESVTSMQATKP